MLRVSCFRSQKLLLDGRIFWKTVHAAAVLVLQQVCQWDYYPSVDLNRAFIAHLEDNLEDKIFVTFACHYGEAVHKAVHAHDYAPKL